MTSREKSIDRIRKLLARAARGGSEHEANTSAAMAAKIMAKHGIESVEVEGDPDPVGDNQDLFVEVSTGKRTVTWKWNLAWTVGQSARCKPYYLSRIVGDEVMATMVGFIGRRSDAQMCCYVMQYLMAELKSIHTRRRPKIGSRVQQYVPGSREPLVIDRVYQRRWSRDFYLGAVAALNERMVTVSEEVMETASSTALVRLRDISEDVNTFAENMGLQYMKGREVDLQTDTAFAEGILAGRTVDLSTDHDALGVGQLRLPPDRDE